MEDNSKMYRRYLLHVSEGRKRHFKGFMDLEFHGNELEIGVVEQFEIG